MLILSWNVAGLSTTVNRIHEAYGGRSLDKNQNNGAQHPSAALGAYFRRHGADIVCLQEHKIPKQQLSSRSEPRQASTVEGYESFWSCCVDEKKKGLNGVVTYAKQGSVVAADAAPLESPDLDQQGRCVMTEHGSFVLFNVYVPASGGQPLSYKMKFLNALRRAMQRQRKEKNKPVLLVGDLNIAHGTRDIYWKDRVLHVNDVLDEVAKHAGEDHVPPKWKLDLSRSWAKIEAVMQTKQVLETQTSNSWTGEKYDKFRLAVTVDGTKVFLGKNEVSEDYCLHCYDFSALKYEDVDTGEEILAREVNTVRLGTLAELMWKIAGIRWEEPLLREIADTAASVERMSPTRRWLTSLLEEDGMIDGFRHFYPTAEARFTCWHQFTNKRYENDGSRIDYTIFDKSLLPQVAKGDVSRLRCCGDLSPEDSFSENAALRAATAGGRFRPVSFEGGGINEATQEALDTQFGPAHTGMIYTPPSFSDHIAVSLLMDDALLSENLTLQENDARTRKAQPHKLQKSIASFFTKGSTTSKSTAAGNKIRSSGLSSSSHGPAKRLKKATKPPVNSILYHFKKKTSD